MGNKMGNIAHSAQFKLMLLAIPRLASKPLGYLGSLLQSSYPCIPACGSLPEGSLLTTTLVSLEL